MKRAQVMLFVLLGLVVLITVLFLVFIITKKQVSKEPGKVVAHTEALQTIKSYVTTCLEKSAKDGLLLIGFNGGYIPGVLKTDSSLTFFNYSVAYGLREPLYSSTYPPAPVPDYPYKGKLEKKDFPYYGRDVLHNLCDPSGSNMLNITSLYRPCESYEDVTSLQQQLTQFVKNRTAQCINFSALHFAAQGIGNLTINVTMGMADVLVSMEFPFTFSTKEKKYVTDVLSHSTKLPVRLKALHEFAKAIITRDRFDHSFDPVKDGVLLPEYKGGFVLHKVQNACPTCKGAEYNDIIAISDTQSQLDGKTYIFQFSRENRIPALEWIHDIPTVFDYDILVEEESELRLNPAGKDPDEETVLKYDYAQWKEDYDEYFDDNCPTLRTDPQKCILRKNTPPHSWTTSQLYQQTKQNASIIVNHTDIGQHVVKVSVKDRQGLTDYQNVVIFVRDKPFFNVTGKSIYHDVPPLLASIEDPFLLQANSRCIFLDCGHEYEWRISTAFGQQPYKVYKTDKSPYQMPSLSPSIETIKPEPFANTGDKVRFKSGQFEFDVKGLKVLQCLPHRDADPAIVGVQDYDPKNPSAHPPYPFQEGDPFYAPHVCCEGDPYADGPKVVKGENVPGFGTYSPPGKVCFSTQKPICSPNLPSFDASKVIPAKTADADGKVKDLIQPPDITKNQSTREDENDIYIVSFTQHCSGSRGNVCGGLADYSITFNESCSDTEGPDERCTGPAGVNKDNCFAKGTAGCFSYAPGDSFEKNFLRDPAANGICNKAFRLASARNAPNTYDKPTGAFLICQAKCDGAGGCTYADNCRCTNVVCNGVPPGTIDPQDTRLCDDNCQKTPI